MSDADAYGEIASFSFLYRNERTATDKIKRELQPQNALSVSSIGTNELQHWAHYPPKKELTVFQFPLSERTNCNLASKKPSA